MPQELLEDPHRYRSDLATICKALESHWSIAKEDLEAVARKAVELSKHEDPRVALRAIQAVVAIQGQVQKDNHLRINLEAGQSQQPSSNVLNQVNIANIDSSLIYELIDRMG